MIAADYYKNQTGREAYAVTLAGPCPTAHFVQWLERTVERHEEKHPTPTPSTATSYVPTDGLTHYLISYSHTKMEPADFAFWRWEGRGYTVWEKEAGRFHEAEAREKAGPHSNSVAIPILDFHEFFAVTTSGKVQYAGTNATRLDDLFRDKQTARTT